MTEQKNVVKTDISMKRARSMEQDTDKALVIVRITNPMRLTADVTEDFFLVDCNYLMKAYDVLKYADFQYVSAVKSAFDKAGIPYEHVINGQRFYFGEDSEKDEPEE